MATFTVDLATGNSYLFDKDFNQSGSTTGTTAVYPEVTEYSNLPLPASLYLGKIYVVRQGAGTYVANRKEGGLYWSDGVNWNRLGDIPSFFNSNNFQVFDGSDNTKGVSFVTSGMSMGVFRKVKFQNSDGTVAYLIDLNTKVDVSLFNTYTGNTLSLINTKLNISNFNTYSGNTKANFNSYSGATLSLINSKVNTILFNTYTGNTKTNFNIYTGNTLSLINSKVNTTLFNNYTGSTQTKINTYTGNTQIVLNSKVNNSLFNTYTGNTQTKFNTYTGNTQTTLNSKLNNSIFNNYTGNTGLQQVTQINAATNIETSFKNGLILNKIRPSGNSTTAIQINKSDGVSNIINIDTVSGFTGFGTKFPNGVIHAYGFDDSNSTDYNGLQHNRIMVDGVSDGDKDIIWADNGHVKWDAQIYRNESGQFWYLYNPDGKINVITASEDGRMGVNARTNIMDYHVSTISGTTREGVIIGGLYTKKYISVYQITINNSSVNPNTFQWRVSKDLGLTYSSWSVAQNVTLIETPLDSGITEKFIKLSGYNTNDTWKFTAFPQVPSGTFIVAPNKFDEVLTTANYNAGTVEYDDVSGDINTSSTKFPVTFLNTGNTNGALFVGTPIKIGSIYFSFLTNAIGATLYVDYWNASASTWENINVGSNLYLDGTSNLTLNGSVSWDVDSLTDWNKGYLNNRVEEGYDLYWIRFRSASPPSVAPIIFSASKGSNKRMAVYAGPFDYQPSFYVDPIGRTNIGGGTISGKNEFQINNFITCQYLSNFDSQVEFDSENSSAAMLRLKLASNDTNSYCLGLVKYRGTLVSGMTSQYGDSIGRIIWASLYNSPAAPTLIADINAEYTGSQTKTMGDIVFSTQNGLCDALNRTEVVRMSASGNTGFGGIKIPTARIHLLSGGSLSNTAPLKFNAGINLSTPEIGAIEYDGNNWYGTNNSGRKTFAFLESPNFSGQPNLPINTCLNNINLNAFILNSGGTNNALLTTTSKFNSYTGSSQPILNSAVTGCTNGLFKTDRVIGLGGTLTQSTSILGGNYDFTLLSKSLCLSSNNGINIYDNNGKNIEIYSSGGTVALKGKTSGGTESLRFVISNQEITLTDNRSITKGIEYTNDYSEHYTSRSLVDKSYVDAIATGLIPKEAVKVATISNVALTGLTIIDGYQLIYGDRILVKDQVNEINNGIYSATTGNWGRTSDYNGNPPNGIVSGGNLIPVLSGNTNSNTIWTLVTLNPVIGSTPLNFTLFSSVAGTVAGSGINVTKISGNNIISIQLANNCGLCSDGSGLHINPSIGGTGLNYSNGIMCVCGTVLAGNSISYTGNTFNVNINSGTLNTALNSKLNTSVFNAYTGNTQTTLNNKLDTIIYSTYTGTTIPNTYYNKSCINTYTGTTVPNSYYNKTCINTYTGNTASAISLKAPIANPTFTGIACASTPLQDTNTCQLATTGFVIGQASIVAPLMNGTVCIGTSLRYSRQDHIHPSDTSRLAVTAFNTYSGTTIPNTYYNKSCINTYTGTTIPNTYYNKSCINTYTGTTVPNTYYNKTCINTYTGTTEPAKYQAKIITTANEVIYNNSGTLTGATGFIYTGSTLTVPNVRITTTPTSASISSPTLFWNSSTKQIQALKLTGGSDTYLYTERTTTLCTTCTTAYVKYVGLTGTSISAGRYRVDFFSEYGNSTSSRCTPIQYRIDNVLQGSTISGYVPDIGVITNASLTRDVTLTAGTHCFDIFFCDGTGGGTPVGCLVFGTIRAKRIC